MAINLQKTLDNIRKKQGTYVPSAGKGDKIDLNKTLENIRAKSAAELEQRQAQMASDKLKARKMATSPISARAAETLAGLQEGTAQPKLHPTGGPLKVSQDTLRDLGLVNENGFVLGGVDPADLGLDAEDMAALLKVPQTKPQEVKRWEPTAEKDKIEFKDYLGYIAGEFGAGMLSSPSGIMGGATTAIGDLATGGQVSAGAQTLANYFAQKPQMLQRWMTNEIGVEQMIMNETGVSAAALAAYRAANTDDWIRKSLQEDRGHNLEQGFKDIAGDIAYTLGQQAPGFVYSMGAPAADGGGILSSVASAIKNKSGVGQALASSAKGALKGNINTWLMGAGAAGNQLTELAKQKGYDPVNYINAMGNGFVEYINEGLLGFSDGDSIKALWRATGSKTGNTLRSVARWLMTSAEEGLEEAINVPMSGIVDKMTVERDKKLVGEGGIFDLKEMLRSGIMGAAVGMIMGGVGGVSSIRSAVLEGASIFDAATATNHLIDTMPKDMRPAHIDPKTATAETLEQKQAEVLDALEHMVDTATVDAFEQGAEQAVQSDAQAAPQMQTEAVQENEQSVDIKQEALNNEQTEILSGRGPQRGPAPIDAGSTGQVERAGTAAAARRNQQQIAQRRTSVAEQNGLRRVSSRELGLDMGTDLRRNVVLEDESLWDDELRSIKKNWDDMNRRRREKYGYTQDMELKFVLGKMQVRDADGADVLVDGVVNDDGSVCVCVNSMTRSATEIAEHEFFHTLEAETPDLVDALWPAVESVGLNDAMVQRYRRFYGETLGYSERMVRAEILADAYAGLERIQGTEMQTVKDMVRQLTGEAQEAIERGWYTPAAEETYESVAGEGRETRGPPVYSAEGEENITDIGGARFSLVTDGETLDFLDSQKLVKVYRAMQVLDGELYPPMAAEISSGSGRNKTSQRVETTKKNTWYQADERPNLIMFEIPKRFVGTKSNRFMTEEEKQANSEVLYGTHRPNDTIVLADGTEIKYGDLKPKYNLEKGDGGGDVPAAYNPYFHTSASPLNDQFSTAYKRPHLVVVEGYIPSSELTSGYKALYAKDSVGETAWKSGPVANNLKGEKARKVYLSRWFKAGRIVPDNEVAGMIAKTLEGENVRVPWNVVTPSLREALEAKGVSIDYDVVYSGKDFDAGMAESGKVAKKHGLKASFSVSDEVDSDGNELSVEQAEFFADSKVRDEDGSLMVMYHGTPNAGFTVFRSGTYFTSNREYADVYQSPGASSISVKRGADNPDTYAAYLNITKPFDTRNEAEREIFENEFYRQWGTGTPLADSGLPDWVDGMDLQEFIEEMGYDYDGLILDEGGTGGYGEEVRSRGLSYVVFGPEQVKNIDNRTPTSDPDIRYSVSDEVDSEGDGVYNDLVGGAANEMSESAADERTMDELRKERQEIQDELDADLFDEMPAERRRTLRNRIVKLDAEIEKLLTKERRAAVKTSMQEILDNLSRYRRADLESLAEQISEGAWDGYENLSRAELEDALREEIENRELSPLEMQSKKYGLFVRPASDIRYSVTDEQDSEYAPTFYSHMERVIENTKQEKLGAASVVSMLKGKGVKNEEIKWSGIETFLEGKKSVTKQELLEFMQGNRLQIEETVLEDSDEVKFTAVQQRRIDGYRRLRDEAIAEIDNLLKDGPLDIAAEWQASKDLAASPMGEGQITRADFNMLRNAALYYNQEQLRLLKERGPSNDELRAVIKRNDDFGFDYWSDALRAIHTDPAAFSRNYDMSEEDKLLLLDYARINANNAKVAREWSESAEAQKVNEIIAWADDAIDAFAAEENVVMAAKKKSKKTQWKRYATEGGENYRELLFRLPGSDYYNDAMQTHWTEDVHGVLAHARIQDFETADGKMLFVEEIQSDWHNAGQKLGYARTEAEVRAAEKRADELKEKKWTQRKALMNDIRAYADSRGMDDPKAVARDAVNNPERADVLISFGIVSEDIGVRLREYHKLRAEEDAAWREVFDEAGKVPDAPFRQNYHEFVLKRLLRMAAEGGYDSLGWTTAKTQADRWSDDFAEGYRIEYDQDIPKFLNKYGKQWGVKVANTYLDNTGYNKDDVQERVMELQMALEAAEEKAESMDLDEVDIDDFLRNERTIARIKENLEHLKGTKVWSMPITDAMRKSVLYEGQPMYSVSDEQEATERPRRDLTPGQELTRKEHTLIKRAINQSKMQLRDIVPAGTKKAREVQQMQILDLAQKLWETGEITQENIDDAFEEIWLKGATVDRELADQYSEVRQALRTGVTVSEALKKEITDYEQFRRANFGAFTIRGGEQSDVDVAYQELSTSYPNLFPADITEPADQLQQMADVAQRLKPVVRTMSEQYKGDVDAKAGMKADFVDLVRNMELEILHPVQEVTKKQKDQKEAERVASYRQIYKEVMDEVFKVQQRETYEPDPEYWHEVADDAWGRMNERAEAIQGEWLRSLTKEGFKGAESLDELGVKIAGSVADYHLIDQILENHRAAQSVRKDIRKAERKLKATSKEKNYAAGIASGVFTEADISGDARPHVVMELADYYMMERIVGLDLIEARRNDMYAEVDYQVESLMQDKDAYKVSSSPVLFYRTPQRNMINMYGREHGQKVYDFLFAPVAENEAERIRWVNRMHDEVRLVEGENGKKKPLNRKERALVQMVMEGRAVAEVVAAMEEREVIYDAAANLRNGQDIEDIVRQFNLNQEMRNTATDYATWLDTNDILQTTKGVDQKRINNAVELYAKQYNRFYKAINDFLAAHGYEPIGFIKGYAPHIQPEATRNLLQSTLKMMGLSEGVTELPASIAGRTHVYRPNKRWNPYFMSRHGDQTEYDVTAGYESYVDYLSDILYHTDDTVRIRRAANYFRRTYAPEEISNNLSWAEGLRNASPEQKAEMLREQNKLKYTETPSAAAIGELFDKYVDELYDSIKDQSKYSSFVNWLEDYANQLTGKQSLADRGMEVFAGRQSLNFANKLNRAFQRANVAGNLSTALNQTAQLPMIVADIGNVNTLLALKDYAVGKVRRDGFKEKSDFLTARKGMNNLVVDPADRVINIMFTPAQVADDLVSTIAARGAYIKAVRQGMSDAEAMRYADRKAEQIMGSRAKGSAPQAFRSKNPLWRMVNMFQIEALNAFEYVEQDLIIQGIKDIKQIDDSKGRAKATAALIGLLGKMLVAAFLWNRTTEELYGGSPAQFDLLGYAANFLASGNGLTANQQLLDWIDMAWERAFGEPLFDIDPDYNEEFDWKNAMSDLGYAVSSDIPMVRNLAGLSGVGDQSLPMPDMRKVYDAGKSLWDNGASLETLDAALAAAGQFLPGGRQINKTYQGARTMAKGGRYYGYGENQRLQYPVEESTSNWVKALLFGPSGLSENTEFYAAGGDDGLSAGNTRKYQELMQVGMTSEMALETYEEYRRINRLEDLTAAEKATEFAKWLADMEVPAEQAKLAREAFMFWGMVPGEATKYDTFVGEGLEADDAYALTEALGALEPEEGETTVSNLQRYRAVLDHTTDEAVRYAALAGVMQDKEFARLRAAYDYVQSGTYVEFLTAFDEAYPGETKSQERVETVLRQMRLDAEERAALWQMCGPKWKTDNNPFSKSVGREVAGLIEEYYAEIDGE